MRQGKWINTLLVPRVFLKNNTNLCFKKIPVQPDRYFFYLYANEKGAENGFYGHA